MQGVVSLFVEEVKRRTVYELFNLPKGYNC